MRRDFRRKPLTPFELEKKKQIDAKVQRVGIYISIVVFILFLILIQLIYLLYSEFQRMNYKTNNTNTSAMGMYSTRDKILLKPEILNFPQIVVKKEGDVEIIEDIEWLFDPPNDINPDDLWRYSSKGLLWLRRDFLFRKFQQNYKEIKYPPASVEKETNRVSNYLNLIGRSRLAKIFQSCYPDTLNRSIALLPDGTSFIITGDIPLMWLRDSAAQIHHYLPLVMNDPQLQVIFEGVIRRQIKFIQLDPYGSSFRLYLDYNLKGKEKLTEWDIKSGRTILIAMHNFEVDSLCYFVRLSYEYWKHSGVHQIFDIEFLNAAKIIINLWEIEQEHQTRSTYSYPELIHDGRGPKFCKTNFIWGAFRPSDDRCQYSFNIAANMFVSISLEYFDEIFRNFFKNEVEILKKIKKLKEELDFEIFNKGVIDTPIGKVYAYEVDGCGSYFLGDDANVPSLLSMFYLGYKNPFDISNEILENTKKYSLSKSNPFYFTSRLSSGIGSSHTQKGFIWPMSLIMEAFSSNNITDINRIINLLEEAAIHDVMHEGFLTTDFKQYTREWFGWANSLFAELILHYLDVIYTQDQRDQIFPPILPIV